MPNIWPLEPIVIEKSYFWRKYKFSMKYLCMLLCLMVSPSNRPWLHVGCPLPYQQMGCLRNYHRRTVKVMVSSLLVGLSVCLCMNWFPWNFQYRSSKIQGTIWQIFGVLCSTPSIKARSYIEVYSSMIQVCYIFFFFQGNPCLLATFRENGWTDFQEIFRKDCTRDKEQSETFSCRGD